MELLIPCILLLFLLFCSGYFSGSEAALFSLPAIRLKAFQSDANPRTQLIAKLLLKPRDLLVTVFMLNTLVNILLQNTTSDLVGDSAGWALKVGLPLFLTLLFGELLPKYLALQNNIAFSYQVAPVIYFLQNILTPIRNAIVVLTTPLSKFMFFFLKAEHPVSSEEIQLILKTSEAHGVFNREEGAMINGYLELQETAVREFMRPREEILYYNLQEPLSKLMHLFVDQKCSRLPICDPDLDVVLGILTAKNFFIHRDEILAPSDVQKYLTKPFYVPETTFAWRLLRRLYEQQQVLALVVDENGSVSGLISREDLIESVVGEITDLRDQVQLYSRAGKHEIIASGKLELETFNQIFDSLLKSPMNRLTIGGWLTERLGEIPKSGSTYELEGFLFQVLAANPSRVRRLYIRKQ